MRSLLPVRAVPRGRSPYQGRHRTKRGAGGPSFIGSCPAAGTTPTGQATPRNTCVQSLDAKPPPTQLPADSPVADAVKVQRDQGHPERADLRGRHPPQTRLSAAPDSAPSSRGRVLCMVTVGHDRHGGICLMGLANPAGPSSAHGRRRVSEGDLNPHGRNLQLCSPRRVSGRITAGQRLANVSEGGVATYVHDPDRPDHGVCTRGRQRSVMRPRAVSSPFRAV